MKLHLLSWSGPRHWFQLMLLSMTLPCHAGSGAAPQTVSSVFEGRQLAVFVPSRLPPKGTRALVIVLHGGMGNAERIGSGQSEHDLNMDSVAERAAFVVAYLNGTPAGPRLGADKFAWNAGGGCCGQPSKSNVDDVGYIRRAVVHLATEYGIEQSRIYGVGHSNGAMMTQRVMCETGLYAAAVPISGPLNLQRVDCHAARGKTILAIHGDHDANVPVAGGRGTRGISRATYNSEERSRQSFVSAGASYEILILEGVDHRIDHIGQAIERAESQTIAEKAARYFGLLDQDEDHAATAPDAARSVDRAHDRPTER